MEVIRLINLESVAKFVTDFFFPLYYYWIPFALIKTLRFWFSISQWGVLGTQGNIHPKFGSIFLIYSTSSKKKLLASSATPVLSSLFCTYSFSSGHQTSLVSRCSNLSRPIFFNKFLLLIVAGNINYTLLHMFIVFVTHIM